MRWCENCKRHGARGYQVGFCPGNTCTRCPWPGCPCTHSAGCDRGHIEEKPDDPASYSQVRKCATCHEWAEALRLLPSEPALRRVS